MNASAYILAGIFLWSIVSLYAIDSIPPDSLRLKRYTLETVRVIADKPSESIGAITHRSIDKGEKAAPMNLLDALQGLSGTNTSVGSKDESNFRIRGFRKNEVKVLIDGRPLNSGYFGNVDMNSIALSGVAEVIMIKGPASTLYGSGTMGGVLNLITREASDKKWIKLGLQTKRNNTHLIELSSSHSFSGWNYWFYSSRSHTDGFVLSESFTPTALENGGVRNHTQNTQYNLQSKLNLELWDFHHLGFSAGISMMDRKQIPASIYESKYRLYKDWQRYHATIMGDFRLSDWTRLYSMSYFDASGDTYLEYNDPHYQYMNVDSKMQNHTLGQNLRLEMDHGGGSSGISNIGFTVEKLSSKRKDNGDYPDWEKHYLNTYTSFIQHHIELWEQLGITLSMGVSAFDLDGEQKYHPQALPALGVIWQSEDERSLSISWGMGNAFPTMRQLFSIDKGNPNLKAQYANKTEISYKQALPYTKNRAALKLSFFYNDVRDLIDLQAGRYENIYQVHTYGGDMEMMLKLHKNWDMSIAYAYLSYPHSDSYTLSESPAHSLDLVQSVHLPYQMELRYTTAYKDKRYSQDGIYSYQSLKPYWINNLQLHKRWKSCLVYLGLENIADTDFEGEYGFPAPGRNFNLGLELEL